MGISDARACRGMRIESADLSFPGRRLMLGLGVQSSGQGHATVFPAIVADRLGVPPNITVRQGNSDLGLKGMASVASRSAMTRAAPRSRPSRSDRERPPSRRRAGSGGGGYRLPGRRLRGCRHGPQRVAFRAGRDGAARETARRDRGEPRHPGDDGDAADFSERLPYRGGGDRSRDRPRGDRAYTAVDDCGTSSITRSSRARWSAGSRRASARRCWSRSSTIRKRPARHRHVQRLRHAARRATCRRSRRSTIRSCRTNPLGVKGVGEAGTTGSIAAIMNAIADAIPDGRAPRSRCRRRRRRSGGRASRPRLAANPKSLKGIVVPRSR